MYPALVLAERILDVIREAGVDKIEAHAALSCASQVVSTMDITFDRAHEDAEARALAEARDLFRRGD